MRIRNQNQASKGFTLVELLVVIAIIGVLVALLLPAIQAAREAARLNTCKNNLKQHGLALLNYHDIHKEFPVGVAGAGETAATGGRRTTGPVDDGYGWGLALLPHLEQQALYDRVNPDFEPGPFRKSHGFDRREIPGGDVVLSVFRCPTSVLPSNRVPLFPDANGYATSDYKASTGLGDSGLFYKTYDGERAGYSRVRVADVTDGLSNTIAFGESAYYLGTSNWPIWLGASGSDEAALFKTDPMAPINCGIVVKSIDNFYTAIDDDCAYSWHYGGALFSFADGSVHWLSDDIDPETYYNLGTKNDGKLTNGYE